MPVVTLENACLAFGHVALLDHVDLQIEAGERVALVGRNGGGKSSLLRVIADEASLDDGTVWRTPHLRVARVPQEPEFDPGHSIFEAVAAGAGATAAMLGDYHVLAARASTEHDAALLERLHEIQHELDHTDGWRLDARIAQVISQLGLDGAAAVAAASGGARKRAALARALVQEPDLLLLDEPTNHLDIDGIIWLEELLIDFAGTVLFITHDRRFLDRVATRLIELDRGRLASFPGNFSRYSERKSELLEMEAKQAAQFDKFLAQEETWIRKGVEARRTRNAGRVVRLERLRRERQARRERLGQVSFGVERGDLSGKLVAELQHVTKAYDGRAIVSDFSCRILRGDKIGLIGPNGAGKSTLLKLMLGELLPDAGAVRLGTKLSVAYFDQLRTQLDDRATLADVISPGSDFIEIESRRQHVIGYLGDFLFPPERARSPVGSLSGGERNRLLLARLFARPANLIVLDEPTNDLDIETLDLLESLLLDYRGTLLLVSHDRAFLDNVVTQTIAAEGDGKWREYAGGYADWERARRPRLLPPARTGTPAPRAAAAGRRKTDAPRAKLSQKEQRELADLPERIGSLEGEQQALTTKLSDAALYRDAPEQVKRITERLEIVEREIVAAMEQWEELERRAGGA